MKHLFVFPVWATLVITSLLIGGIMYMWSFSSRHFRKGANFINMKVVRFTNWYDFSI